MSIVNIFVSAEGFNTERRFEKGLLIEQLKAKLETLVGIPPSSQRLSLYNGETMICSMEGDDAVMLGAFPVEDYMRIHLMQAPHLSETSIRDVSLVDKYEMPENEYAKRFGKNDELEHLPAAEDTFEKEASAIKVGERCQVDMGSGLKRRGTVKFVGTTKFKPGFWIGIHYDEPFGKNDGSIEGERYFTCPPKYGAFIRPNKVVTGDFPEEDINDDDLEEM